MRLTGIKINTLIDIYDKTETKHSQWPNKAWPPNHNGMQFQESVKKRDRAYTLAELKAMGVTPVQKNQYQLITI
jgi:hypothetical protein